MRILDKHITKEFISSLLTCLAIFLFLFVIIDSFTNLDDFIKNKIPLMIVAKYYLAIIPMVFVQTSPIACLMAIIYTMGKLNYNNELIAMRSSGLSIYKIVMPLFIVGVILSLISFLVTEKVLPVTQHLSDTIKAQYIEEKHTTEETYKNLAIYGFNNKQMFINSFNAKTNVMEGLTILKHDRRQNVISKVFANKVKWENGVWIAEQYLLYNFDQYNHVIDSRYLENYTFKMEETPSDILKQRQKINYMNSRELFSYINRLSGSGAETALRYLWIEFYQKMLSHFTPLIMILIGLPCAITVRRKGIGFSSVGISVLVALLYYVILAVSIALGKSSVFPALASVLITPVLFICVAVFLISINP
ncbi:MAG: LptF/LptG family permease [Candidatus Omnitrophica bacterium]|nr:LptF/LptG family permease [Candidatus Omnitrophota bacterium]MDD5355392.1 LptF/LptG family permease [Candidatus Omnitrophota bacterium]